MELGWLFLVFAALALGVLLASVALGVALVVLGTLRRSTRRSLAGLCILAAATVLVVLLFIIPARSLRPCLQAPYLPPPRTFKDSDLAGTWDVHYMEWGHDTLIVREDGTFKQIYRDRTVANYVYETPWSQWSVEYLAGGRVRLHLSGARHYLDGIRIAEEDGTVPACPEQQPDSWWCAEPSPRRFFDPVGHDGDGVLYMVGELVLNVRCDSSGELHLLHMRAGGNEGFGIVCWWEEFRRVETP